MVQTEHNEAEKRFWDEVRETIIDLMIAQSRLMQQEGAAEYQKLLGAIYSDVKDEDPKKPPSVT